MFARLLERSPGAVLEAIRAADAAYGNPHRHAGLGCA